MEQPELDIKNKLGNTIISIYRMIVVGCLILVLFSIDIGWIAVLLTTIFGSILLIPRKRRIQIYVDAIVFREKSFHYTYHREFGIVFDNIESYSLKSYGALPSFSGLDKIHPTTISITKQNKTTTTRTLFLKEKELTYLNRILKEKTPAPNNVYTPF